MHPTRSYQGTCTALFSTAMWLIWKSSLAKEKQRHGELLNTWAYPVEMGQWPWKKKKTPCLCLLEWPKWQEGQPLHGIHPSPHPPAREDCVSKGKMGKRHVRGEEQHVWIRTINQPDTDKLPLVISYNLAASFSNENPIPLLQVHTQTYVCVSPVLSPSQLFFPPLPSSCTRS